MSTSLVSLASSPREVALEGLFAFAEKRGIVIRSAAFVGAIALHAAAAFAYRGERHEPRAEPPPLEIEMAPATPTNTPPPAPEPAVETPEPEPTTVKSPTAPKPPANALEATATPKPTSKAPAAAKAGNLLVAKDDGAKSGGDEPVSFVTDPNGASYGSGVVAKGGTADVGLPNAKVGGVVTPGKTLAAPTATFVAPSTAPTIVPAANLSRMPKLEEANACRGFFPGGADDDAADTTLVVVIKPDGAVSSASVVLETPKGQGFGNAARTCLLSKHFAPGLDKSGTAVLSSTTIRVHFSR